jgi:Mrp family chromosome partitioning ATPase
MDDSLIPNPTASQRLTPLLSALRGQDGDGLRRILSSGDAARTFNAIENELFLQEPGAASIAVASVARGEGRTTLAVLTAAYAAAVAPGRRVLLVDADFENGRLGQTLGLPDAAPGFGELLAGSATAEECFHPSVLPNLMVTPAARPGESVGAYTPLLIERFLDAARSRFDLVIADTAAGGPNPSALAIARMTGDSLIVIRYGGPTREQISAFVGDLQRVGTRVIGCVLNQREYVVPKLLYGHG